MKKLLICLTLLLSTTSFAGETDCALSLNGRLALEWKDDVREVMEDKGYFIDDNASTIFNITDGNETLMSCTRTVSLDKKSGESVSATKKGYDFLPTAGTEYCKVAVMKAARALPDCN